MDKLKDEIMHENDEIRHQNKIASSWLVYYRERKQEHEEKRLEIETYNRRRDEIARGSAGLNDVTANIAIALTKHDTSNIAKWLKVVEMVYGMVGYKKQLLIRLRQECKPYTSSHSGRPGWVAPVQVRFGEVMGWCPAERTLKDIWWSIVNLTVRVALIRGCKF